MSITLRNSTDFVAQYVVKKGTQILSLLPGIEPGAKLNVPTDETYEVVATTLIDGNTYTSAPIEVSGSMGFLAQVLQVESQGTYEFDVQESPSNVADQLSFQKTCHNPVTFTITKDGKPLQNVVVNDSYHVETVDISETFSIHAVIDGVTTSTLVTTNADAVITATTNDSNLESGYFRLVSK
ncbi:hypothetical protein ACMXYN_07655 [Neptuniibacter sp. PT8_73]|uniref:hypothetical protein n=1 Tax=unclassified Neptuniibacter TaxID=2630693 RepID=UPI0039F576C0